MARALYRSWFVDFDPVHAKAQGRAPAHMDPTTAALFPDRFGEDGLPEGWEMSTIGDVCKQVKKTVKPMAAPEAEFLHFSLPAFDASRMPIREFGSAIKSNKAHVPHDAILFSRLNPAIPRVWWAKTERVEGTPAASTEFFVALAHDPVETPWLYSLLSSPDFRDAALSRVTGTSNSHQRVPPKALREIEVVAPSRKIVEAFGVLSGAWFEKVHAMAGENQTLAQLRDTLLPKLMSGELRIREAEKQVEEIVSL
jgi:type I restriction enzyme S subunit